MQKISLRSSLRWSWCAALYALSLPSMAAAPSTLYAHWYTPQVQQTVASAQGLQDALRTYCAAAPANANQALTQARQQFARSVQHWERLAAVAMGPMVDRRSARVVDFQPLRPALLKRAMAKNPSTLQAMEEVGGPAKGFPAIEYLLWAEVAVPQTGGCNYAVMAAADITQEFRALQADLQAPAVAQQADFFLVEEFVNQWLGGLERLRWQNMEKPMRSAAPGKPLQVLRMESQGTVASWQAQWSGLRSLALEDSQHNSPMRLATLIKAKGWDNVAQRLTQAVAATDKVMAEVRLDDAASIEAATKSMSHLKRLVEAEIAPTLDVTIGFSDADGD